MYKEISEDFFRKTRGAQAQPSRKTRAPSSRKTRAASAWRRFFLVEVDEEITLRGGLSFEESAFPS